jgi:hypothetical protein
MRRRLFLTGLSLLLIQLGPSPATADPLATTALVQVSGASPFAPSCGLEAAGGQVFLDSEVEPFVSVNPTDPANLVGIWQQDRWSNGGARGNVAGVSFDGGASWQLVLLGGVTECDGGAFDRASDPWVSFGPDGTVYAMHLVTDAAPPADKPGGFGRNGMMVQRSTDGGLTWDDPILIAEEDDGDGLHDKNTITADTTRPGFAYAVWDFLDIPPGGTINPDRGVFGGGLGFKGGSLISRTTDGGLNWSSPSRLYNPGGVNQTIGNQIVVQPSGRLVNVFNEILNFRNDDLDAQFDFNLSLKFSTDAGATWLPKGRPVRFGDMLPRTLFTPFPFVGVYQPDAEGQDSLAGANAVRSGGDVIPEVAAGPEGNLYVVWQDARFSAQEAGGFDDPTQLIDEVAFSMSTDGGSTWSEPIKANQTPDGELPLGNRQAFTPMVRVLDDGTVAVSYYDFRNNTSGDDVGSTDLFVVHCNAACSNPASWGDEEQVTSDPFDITEAPFAGGFFLGDYVGLGTDGVDLLPFFTQTGGTGPTDQWFARVGP